MQGVLAADFAMDRSGRYAAWNAVVPRAEDLSTLPLAWDPRLQALLPAHAAERLARQQGKLARDWAAVSARLPGAGARRLRARLAAGQHALLLLPRGTGPPPKRQRREGDEESDDVDDCMAQLPVADLFNHAEAGCHVSFDEAGFAVRADRPYARGEEVVVAYGRHTNDFLLAEYGFVLAENRWERRGWTTWCSRSSSADHRARLREARFPGQLRARYPDGVHTAPTWPCGCCACRCETGGASSRGADDGAESDARVDALLLEMLARYRHVAEERISAVDDLGEVGEARQRELLRLRWTQLRVLAESGHGKAYYVDKEKT